MDDGGHDDERVEQLLDDGVPRIGNGGDGDQGDQLVKILGRSNQRLKGV